MTGPGDDAPLLGVVASPAKIEAQLVERTPFGRLRSAGRRLTEDVDGPTRFVPLPVQRQLAKGARAPEEERAADAWVQSIANAIAKLIFGVRGGAVRVGLAIDARLDGVGRRVMASRGGPRMDDVVESLSAALRGRSIDLVAPIDRAVSLARAHALGEIWSPLGGLAGGIDGVVLVWDHDVSWADVARAEVVRDAAELPGGRMDLGLARLDAMRAERVGDGRRIAVGARRGELDAQDLLAEAAEALGGGTARRLLRRAADELGQPGDAATRPAVARVVLTGTCGRFAADPRLERCVLKPFELGLANGLLDREDAAMRAGMLELNDGVASLAPGVVHVSRDDSAAVLGAAASALRGLLPDDSRIEPGDEGER